MHANPLKQSRFPARQHGIALVLALVFLLAAVLLGLAAFSTNTSEARMSYAAADFNRAFQATESAVSQGEGWLSSQVVQPPECASSCTGTALVWTATSGSQIPPPYTATFFSSSWWNTYGLSFASSPSEFGGTATTRTNVSLVRTGGAATGGTPPTYLIEDLGQDRAASLKGGQGNTYRRYYYQVTGHATGVQTQTNTVAQSVYVQGY
jgi:type IV pilus assembly protein PilX